MIITTIDSATLLRREPTLDKYLPDTQLDFEPQIVEAKREIIQNLKDHKRYIKKYCTPLVLQASVDKTTSFDGEISEEDTIERMIWTVKVTAITGNVVLILQGTNDDGTTYTDVGTLVFDAIGSQYLMYEDVYTKYRVTYTRVDTSTVTYSSNLIESSFYLAHLYLSLSLCYQLNAAESDDIWDKKSKYYYTMYETQMQRMIVSYDADGSGDLSSSEIHKPNIETELFR